MTAAADVRLVPARPLVVAPVDVVFALAPGDRPLVAAGESVVVGAPIAERLRDPGLDEVQIPPTHEPRPGHRWSGPASGGDGRIASGELLFNWHGRWRVATGDVTDPIETPIAGIVRDVRPGTSITVRAAGRGIRGVVALGGPTRGRLQGSARQRAARRWTRRRLGRDDPRRRIAGGRGDADPGPGDGRSRGRRGRAVEQGAARLPRLRGAPAGGPPPAAVVRRAGARWRRPATHRRRRAGDARRAGRARGGDRDRSADARLRSAGPGGPDATARPRTRPGRGAGRTRRAVRRGARRPAVPGRRSTWRPASSVSPTGPRPRSRWATWSDSSSRPRPAAAAGAAAAERLPPGGRHGLRLRSVVMAASTLLERRRRGTRSRGHVGARPCPGPGGPTGRPDLPVGRSRGRQDPPGQGDRGGPRGAARRSPPRASS